MNDKKFLAQHIKDLEASVDSYSPSPQNQKNSELWVANSFTENLCIPYKKSEFTIPSEDPPDIDFRDAHFEIKEILDPDRRRHDDVQTGIGNGTHCN